MHDKDRPTADPSTSTDPGLRTRALGWITPSLWTVVGASVASGAAAFAVTALVGDVARAFGEPGAGDGVAAQIGVTGTALGIALAVIRLASLAALPAAALADRYGRRQTLLGVVSVGLALMAVAAFSSTFWWWVAIVALARPFLSTVNAVSGVVAAEETGARHRSWALAAVGAAYGLGAGVVPLLRAVAPDVSFRVVLGLLALPLVVVPWLAARMREPAAWRRAAASPATRVPGAVPGPLRVRLALLLLTTGALSLATGPGFTFMIVYGEEVLGASTTMTAVLVMAAGPAGLTGLLLGRWLGDRVGRRPTCAAALVATAISLGIAYSGLLGGLQLGYLLAITTAATFGTPAAALAAEAFPTSVRSTVAGWVTAAGVAGAVAGLAAFGVLADVTGGFADAARLLGVVVALGALPLLGLPETRGTESLPHDIAEG